MTQRRDIDKDPLALAAVGLVSATVTAHVVLGVSLAPFVALAAVTGLLWLAVDNSDLFQSGRLGWCAVGAVVLSVALVRLLPAVVAVTVPLLVVGVALFATAPATARRRLSPAIAGGVLLALAWTDRGALGHVGALVVLLVAALAIAWSLWRLAAVLAALMFHRPGWVLAFLTAPVATLLATVYVVTVELWYLVVAVAVTVGCVLMWGHWLWLLARRRDAERRAHWWDQRLGEQVAAACGWTEKTMPCEHESGLMMAWPEDRDAAGAVIQIRTARGWPGTDSQLRTITEQTNRLLGGSWLAEHRPSGNHVELTRQPEAFVLPNKIDYQDTTGSANQIPIGVRGNGEPVIFDLRGEAPHALIAASSRKGKTTLLSVITAHVANHDGLVTILDPKIAGFTHTFRDLPNVRVLTPAFGGKVPAMADAIIEFKAEIDARYAEIAAHRRTEASYDQEIRMLVIDEMDQLTDLLTDDWGRRGTPPALTALKHCLGLGGMARCHLVTAAQHPDIASLGGKTASIRSAYDLKVALGKPGEELAAKMFGSTAKVPPVPDGRGRAVMEFDSVLECVQLAYLDITDGGRAREIAKAGSARFPTAEPVPTAPVPAVQGRERGESESESSRAPAHSGPLSPLSPVSLIPGPDTTTDWFRGRPKLYDATCHRCAREFRTATEPGRRAKCPGCQANVAVRMQAVPEPAEQDVT